MLADPQTHLRAAALFPETDKAARQLLDQLLTHAVDPEAVTHYLQRFHREKPQYFERLTRLPVGLQLLTTVFGYSRFLSEEVLQHPEWLEDLVVTDSLHRAFTAQDYQRKLAAVLEREDQIVPLALTLAQFRRQQILRILLRDALALCDLAGTTAELSHLADAILELTLYRLRLQLQQRYGRPRWENPEGTVEECGFSVIALGKLGGEELNYSSDIDLMFLYSGNGQTDGGEPVTNKEFFKKLANAYIDLLSTYTAEGMCYRVDLRLRPDGRLGEICLSLDGAKQYYATRGRDWELQMLIKARVAAGDRRIGEELLAFVEPRTYSTTLDFSAVEQMSETRERLNEKLAAKRRATQQWDIKLARGGIRDIEFLVQCLQRLHGGRESWVRHGGTLLALSRLRDKDLLSDLEYSQLATAYQFLRHLEHRLQFFDDRQTHALPTARAELEALARRMPARQAGGTPSAEGLLQELHQHCETVQVIYERVIHAQQPLYYSGPAPGSLVPLEELPPPVSTNIVRHLDQKAPELATKLTQSGLRRGRRAFEQLLERITPYPDLLEQLNTDSTLSGYVFDLFELSPYLAEQLVRAPELLGQLVRLAHETPPDLIYADLPGMVRDPGELRRLFKREMIRIQTESLCLARPIFRTLEQTSDLADAGVACAYNMAVAQISESHPPAKPGYEPREQMMVIALGRLGMREFDLASDADLLFVLPDEDQPELQYWTRVAERLIQILSAYTKDGVIFAVDTRLRPNGRQAGLVQSASAYKKYFATQAEAWEGIAYMKARAIAGDIASATTFLNELQEVDWRHYGQNGRSRQDLKQMRSRLEKEQGSGLALKAGFGGYYDIDFALMYLRLKSAGIFFKVLNTPERIDIVEKMGHLERGDAEFLREAASFYRAVDHGLRLYSGHSEGSLPTAAGAMECLTTMVRRWTGPSAQGETLEQQLARVQKHTRAYFERLFC